MDGSIDELDLSVRSINVLRTAQIATIAQIDAMSDQELLRLPNCGRRSLAEIREAVKRAQAKQKKKSKKGRLKRPESDSGMRSALAAIEAGIVANTKAIDAVRKAFCDTILRHGEIMDASDRMRAQTLSGLRDAVQKLARDVEGLRMSAITRPPAYAHTDEQLRMLMLDALKAARREVYGEWRTQREQEEQSKLLRQAVEAEKKQRDWFP